MGFVSEINLKFKDKQSPKNSNFSVIKTFQSIILFTVKLSLNPMNVSFKVFVKILTTKSSH